MCIGSVSNDHIHLLTYIGFVAKVKWVIMNENKVRKLDIARGQGTGGVWGGPTPSRIRDLYSKNFEHSQKKKFFLVSDTP